MKCSLWLLILLFNTNVALGQRGLSFSLPFIFSAVEATNNFGPHRKLSGNAIGYGGNLKYSFSAKILGLNKNFSLTAGAGYFRQRFNVERPFHYKSPIEIMYYTDHYLYDNLQAIAGISYKYPLKQNYSLSLCLTYSWLNSYRQKYTPTYSDGIVPYFSQVERRKRNFGNLFFSELGLKRRLKERYAIALDATIPMYIRWKMDKIFDDDPTKYWRPLNGFGFNISVAYYLKSNNLNWSDSN